MTRAPSNLLAVRSLLLTHLDNAPGPDDLDPAEVGIVGDPAHRGGYHCGSDRVVHYDYSVFESDRDRNGLTLDAAALDVGQFEVRSAGRTHNLPSFSVWCVAQCAANAPDTRDIREIIYSPDGKIVKRWDRLGRRSTGDSSHRWHTHFSFFRDAIRAGRDQRPLFRRYLSSIGLLEDEDMTPEEHQWLKTVHQWTQTTGWADSMRALALLNGTPASYSLPGDKQPRNEPNKIAETLAALKTQVTLLSGRDFVDESAIARDLLAALTPEKIAAAIPTTMARQVADELARRLVAGEPATPQG